MKNILSVFVLLIMLSSATAQSKKFANEMRAALHLHDTAKVINSELASLEAFKKLAEKYPNEWLPGYWAAYLCNQIARLSGRDPNFPKNLTKQGLIDQSTKYIGIAKKNASKVTEQEKSDLYALQGLLYSIVEGSKYDTLMQDEYKKAIKINPSNVNLQVQFAIGLTRENLKYQNLVTALAIFDNANQFFSKIENRALTTYYSKDFVGFWRGQAMDKLTKALSPP
jgi:hypothetical protein